MSSLPKIGDGAVTSNEGRKSVHLRSPGRGEVGGGAPARPSARGLPSPHASAVEVEESYRFDTSPIAKRGGGGGGGGDDGKDGDGGNTRSGVVDADLCPYEPALKEVYMAVCRDTGEIPSEDGITRFRNKRTNLFNASTFALRSQNLSFNAGVVIARVLSGVSSITKIDLYGNVLRDGGVLALVQLLRANPAVRWLNLGANDIGTEGGNALAGFLRGNTTLDVLELGSDMNNIHPNRFRASVVQAICKVLKHENDHLKRIDLTRTTLDDSVALCCNYFKNTLIANTALTSVKLGANNIGTDAGKEILEAFLHNRTIVELDLSHNKLDNKVASLFERVFESNSMLHSVNLSFNQLGRSFATMVSEALSSNTSLLRLELEGNKIGDEGAMAVAHALSRCHSLTYLNVSGNGIETYAGMEFARLLAHPDCAVTVVKMSNNKLGDSCAAAIASSLEVNTRLIRIEMNSCHIGDKGATRLALSLHANRELRALRLNNNYISDEAGMAFITGLDHNSSLCLLELKGNRVEVGLLDRLKRMCIRNVAAKKMEEPKRLKDEIKKLKGVELEMKEVEVAIRKEKAKTEMEASKKQQLISDLSMLIEEEKLSFTRIQLDHDDEKEKLKIALDQKEQKQNTHASVKKDYEDKVKRITEMIETEAKALAELDTKMEAMAEKQEKAEKEHQRRMRDLKLTISSAVQTRDAAIAKSQAMEKEIAELEAHVGRTPDIVSAEKPKKKAPVSAFCELATFPAPVI
mmetsp:Transcript_30579/g.79777  ORF Transcript_30579/g.79777 Transcript_30579/m.79777 type:complete len:748 (-) Transcript_30579:2283-4526(-)